MYLVTEFLKNGPNKQTCFLTNLAHCKQRNQQKHKWRIHSINCWCCIPMSGPFLHAHNRRAKMTLDKFAFWKKHCHLDCCYDWYNTLWMEYYNFTDINISKWNITIRTTSEINWTLSYLVKMLHFSWHCGKWVLSISRHQYENGQNKYVVYFDQDFSCHVIYYFPLAKRKWAKFGIF